MTAGCVAVSILKPARDLTPEERAAACVVIVEGNGQVRYVNGAAGSDIAPDTLVDVPGGGAS